MNLHTYGALPYNKAVCSKMQESVTLVLGDFLKSGRSTCFSNKPVRTAVPIQIKRV